MFGKNKNQDKNMAKDTIYDTTENILKESIDLILEEAEGLLDDAGYNGDKVSKKIKGDMLKGLPKYLDYIEKSLNNRL